MKILTVSSLYPPDYLSGYELACAEIMNQLRARGHEIHILTSFRRNNSPSLPPDDAWTHRSLSFAPLSQTQEEAIVARAYHEWRNNSACRHWIKRLRPDIISVWDMWGLLPSILVTLERSGIPLSYAISSPWALDYAATPHRWPTFWEATGSAGIKKWGKKTIGPILKNWIDPFMPIHAPKPNLGRAFFVSRALREEHARAGWRCKDSPIIYHGVDIEKFSPKRKDRQEMSGKLLVSGRVVPGKGFHVAVEALSLLAKEDWKHKLSLDIVGPQPDPDYVVFIQEIIRQHHLENAVYFHNQVPRDHMPEVYQNHDILIFSSSWEEPFALTMLEAMACGIPVAGTTTGGSKEILEHEITGLVFTAGDATSLAHQLKRILADPELGYSLARRAQQRIHENFTITRTVDQIEKFLYYTISITTLSHRT